VSTYSDSPLQASSRPLAHVIAHLLRFVAIHAHAFAGMQQFQQHRQARIGPVDARQRRALARRAPLALQRLAVGRVHFADALQARQQGNAVGSGVGGKGGFQRPGNVVGQLAGGIAQRGEQVRVAVGAHGGFLM